MARDSQKLTEAHQKLIAGGGWSGLFPAPGLLVLAVASTWMLGAMIRRAGKRLIARNQVGAWAIGWPNQNLLLALLFA